MTKHIKDLQSLDREIYLLRLRARELEEKIDISLNYLQDNYSSMTMKSVFPFLLQKAGFTGSILQIFLQNERLKENLGRLTDYLFERISDGLEYLADKVSTGKDDRL